MSRRRRRLSSAVWAKVTIFTAYGLKALQALTAGPRRPSGGPTEVMVGDDYLRALPFPFRFGCQARDQGFPVLASMSTKSVPG